jgi:uncharacterized protein
MAKNIFLIIIIFLIFLGIYILYWPIPLSKKEVLIKNKKFTLEIAKTISQKAKGLSNRTSLCNNCGMIFVYNSEGFYPFWMKDTLIPLDMIWINNNNEIVSIYTAIPEINKPLTQLTIYRNDKPAKNIIELNAGEANKLGLKIGEKIW